MMVYKGRLTKRLAPKGYQSIDKVLAKTLYDAKVPITIAGNNVNSFHIFNGWYLGYTPSIDCMIDQSFETMINAWFYYLDSELGSYPVFYVKKVGPKRIH